MKYLRPALVSFVLLSLITGLAYPMVVTGLAQALFPHQANGSLVSAKGKVIGSELIGQEFKQPQYFWGRLSATSDHPYNGLASGGSNLATGNPALQDAIKARIAALKKYPTAPGPVPVDLVTASASGLDPHISPAAAYYQVPRIMAERHLDEASLQKVIQARTEAPAVPGVTGEARINVLALNQALDQLPKP